MAAPGLFAMVCLGCVLSAQSPVPTSSALLVWTAVGDDMITGRATVYDIRYLAGVLSEATWGLATPVQAVPFPSLAGSTDSVRVYGLEPGMTYQFGLKTLDEVSHASALSNIVTWTSTSVGVDPPNHQAVVWAEPNPFRRRLLIHFTLVAPTRTKLVIYDLVGRHTALLFDGPLPAGPHSVTWDASQVPPGIYWYQLIRGDRSHRGKVVRIN